MIVSQGDWSIFVTRPISATFLALTALALVVIVLPKVRRRRDQVFTERGIGERTRCRLHCGR